MVVLAYNPSTREAEKENELEAQPLQRRNKQTNKMNLTYYSLPYLKRGCHSHYLKHWQDLTIKTHNEYSERQTMVRLFKKKFRSNGKSCFLLFVLSTIKKSQWNCQEATSASPQCIFHLKQCICVENKILLADLFLFFLILVWIFTQVHCNIK